MLGDRYMKSCFHSQGVLLKKKAHQNKETKPTNKETKGFPID